MTREEALRLAVEQAIKTKEMARITFSEEGDAYAYPVRNGVCAGVNDPICVWQGKYNLKGELQSFHDSSAEAKIALAMIGAHVDIAS